MANNQRGGGIQRPNGSTQSKICQFKLVLLGESAVGKSSLVLRFVKGQFHEYQESTIGAAFLTQTVHIDDTAVKFEIWVSFKRRKNQDFFSKIPLIILGYCWSGKIS